MATTDLETSLVRELEPILGDQPGEIAIQQSLERITYHPATRQVSVSLRDGSRFRYSLPVKPERRSKAGRVPAINRMMALAICYQELARERRLRSYGELATLGRLTRSRVSLMLLLTNLAPAIQEELLFLPKVISGPERISEQQLRSIAKVIDWDEQIALFRSLWDSSSPTGRHFIVNSADAFRSGVGYSLRALNGTHVPRLSGTPHSPALLPQSARDEAAHRMRLPPCCGSDLIECGAFGAMEQSENFGRLRPLAKGDAAAALTRRNRRF